METVFPYDRLRFEIGFLDILIGALLTCVLLLVCSLPSLAQEQPATELLEEIGIWNGSTPARADSSENGSNATA